MLPVVRILRCRTIWPSGPGQVPPVCRSSVVVRSGTRINSPAVLLAVIASGSPDLIGGDAVDLPAADQRIDEAGCGVAQQPAAAEGQFIDVAEDESGGGCRFARQPGWLSCRIRSARCPRRNPCVLDQVKEPSNCRPCDMRFLAPINKPLYQERPPVSRAPTSSPNCGKGRSNCACVALAAQPGCRRHWG